jgi:hypothetical protein
LTPPAPCPELPIYTTDYAPYPEAVDWDGDGKLDLLLGGYVTGMIFHYRNVSPTGSGAPVLAYQGALEADGQAIDVGWSAAPTSADWRGVGAPDLIVGSMRVRPNAGFDATAPALFYYENVGTKEAPELRQVPFPLEGDEWSGLTGMVLPRAVDWDGDGKMDLIVGVGEKGARLLRNVGTANEPLFRKEQVLTGSWEHYAVAAGALSTVASDRDRRIHLLQSGGSAASLSRNTSPGNPRSFAAPEPLLKRDGSPITHQSETGDDFCHAIMYDWRKRGVVDLLVGDAQGYVWHYRRAAGASKLRFREGERFRLAGGGWVRAGIGHDETRWDTHVGARATVGAGDLNGDGINDLVVGDAFGDITYLENVGTNERPRFAPGKVVLRGAERAFVCVADWNQDGLLDLVVGWSGEGINICLNEGTRQVPRFGAKAKVEAPIPIYYPCPSVCDWDGDGDQDLITTCSYGYLYFLDRMFIEQGYANAELVAQETRETRGQG